MSHGIARLGKGLNQRVVPAIDEYDDLLPGWTEEEHRVLLGRSGSIAGYWEGEPGWVHFTAWPYTEVCILIEGHIAIECADGTLEHFHSGEAFVIPAGLAGTWHTLQATRKYFVGVTPG